MAKAPVKKKEDAPENNTGTELEILQRIESAWRRNNPSAQKRNTADSYKWFSSYVGRSFNRVGTAAMFRDRKLWKNGASLKMGKMYFYEYDALHKDTLPLWDRYPLVIFFDMYKSKAGANIILGLNFHYLPPALRMVAFRALLKFKTENRFRSNTRLDFSWTVIKTLAQSKYFAQAIHAYRMDHFKSVLVEIPAQSWELALFLPTARWVGDKSQLGKK